MGATSKIQSFIKLQRGHSLSDSFEPHEDNSVDQWPHRAKECLMMSSHYRFCSTYFDILRFFHAVAGEQEIIGNEKSIIMFGYKLAVYVPVSWPMKDM